MNQHRFGEIYEFEISNPMSIETCLNLPTTLWIKWKVFKRKQKVLWHQPLRAIFREKIKLSTTSRVTPLRSPQSKKRSAAQSFKKRLKSKVKCLQVFPAFLVNCGVSFCVSAICGCVKARLGEVENSERAKCYKGLLAGWQVADGMASYSIKENICCKKVQNYFDKVHTQRHLLSHTCSCDIFTFLKVGISNVRFLLSFRIFFFRTA